MSLQINPDLQAVVAPLTPEEYDQLKENIRKDGLLEPIALWEEQSGTIVDGHNRYAICQELGIGFKTKALSFPNIEAVKLWILEHQVGRRNLTDDQRAIIWNDIREQRAAVSRAAAIVKARDAKVNPGPVEDNASPTKPRTMAAVVAESKIPERALRKAQKLKQTNPDLYERVPISASRVVRKVYLCTSDQPAETGGERPHKMKSPQTPFLTTGLARAWESLKWWGLGFQLHLQRHRRLVGAALAAKSTGSP